MSEMPLPVGRILRCIVVTLLLCSVSATGYAQDGKASDAEKAKEHFEAGASHFYEKEYSRAIVEFMKAYRYKPDPMILFNVSAAHARLENYEDARRFARRAADSGKLPAKIAPRNHAHIAAWSVWLRAADVASDIDEQQKALAKKKTQKNGDGIGHPKPIDKSSTDGLGALGWTGVSMVVVGAGLTGYATYVDMSLTDDLVAYEKAAREDRAEYERLRSDIESQQQAGRIALYSGVGLGTLGLTLWLADAFGGPERDSVSIGIAPGVDSASVEIFVPFE